MAIHFNRNAMSNNFEFINGIDLSDTQIDQVTCLLFDTGYYKECAIDNKLNLSALEFHKQVTILPALSYIRALIDTSKNVIAFHLCLTKKETIQLYANQESYFADTHDNQQLMMAIDNLYTVNSEDYDLIRHNSCIRKDIRGKGMLRVLLLDQIAIAKQKSCTRMFSCIWESKQDSLAKFKHYGAKIIDVLDFTNTELYKDRLLSLVANINEIEIILKIKHELE